jgi:hypothetical protein
LIAAVGQEHKLGRWSINKGVKNAVVVIKLDILAVAPVVAVDPSEQLQDKTRKSNGKQRTNGFKNKKFKL